jgi:hypothetical protein
MPKNQKIVISIILFLMIFSIGTMIIVKTIDYLAAETDLQSFGLVLFARITSILGFLFIIGYAFLKGDFRNLEKPKTDILELHEKIEEIEKKKREKVKNTDT